MKTQRKSLLVSLFSAFAAGVSGCAVDDDGASDDIEVRTDALRVFPAANENGIQYGTMYTWPTNGLNRVPLIQGEENACFLNSVWGKFSNFGAEVRVSMTSGGQWEISGQASGTDTPSGDAYCIRGYAATPEKSATNGQIVAMGVDPSRHTCYLTSLGGTWNSDTVFARLVQTSSDWVLEVSSGGSSRRASARCVRRVSTWETWITGANTEAQLLGLSSDDPPVRVDAINTTIDRAYLCALTRLQGQLTGPDSRWIGTYLKAVGDGTYAWKLGRGPHVGNIWGPTVLSASARCVR